MILPLQVPRVAEQGLPAAIVEVRADRFTLAWEATRAESRPLERAQAETYVRHHAGDLEGALHTAEQSLLRDPDDAWLLASAAEIALALHRGAQASGPIARLEQQSAATGAPASARLVGWKAELEELEGTEQSVRAGIRRAHWVTALAGVSILLALVFLGRASGTHETGPPARR